MTSTAITWAGPGSASNESSWNEARWSFEIIARVLSLTFRAAGPELAADWQFLSDPMQEDRRDPREDALLIERIAQGDRLAMQVLFARHRLRVFRFILRFVRDEGNAEDVLADVFLDVWRQANSFQGRSAVSTWLLSIARFKALSQVRKRTESALDDDYAAGIKDEADDPEVELAKRDKGAALRKCLQKLSSEHRETIELVYYHEKSVEDVAQIVGVPAATVKTRLFYARQKLSEICKREGIDRGWP
jgi:RNA polymerase sigma-70 factor, ECF subfamily